MSLNKLAKNENSESNKWKYSILAGLVFIAVSLPCTYRLTSYVTIPIADALKADRDTVAFVLHTIVFILVIRALMIEKKD